MELKFIQHVQLQVLDCFLATLHALKILFICRPTIAVSYMFFGRYCQVLLPLSFDHVYAAFGQAQEKCSY